MANYYGVTRTNYFRVKSINKLKKLAEKLNMEVCVSPNQDFLDADILNNGRRMIQHRKCVVMFSDIYGDREGALDSYYDEDTDEYVDAAPLIQELLHKGETCIVTHTGHEKAAYLDAYMQIITKDTYEHIPLFDNEMIRRFVDENSKSTLSKNNSKIWG